MEFFEKTISNLIETQFPDVYRENGVDFVEFVKAYYEWMESDDNVLFHSRRLLEHRDIDTTIDEFLIHFKNKYLNSIQFETASSAKNMVKHSLDLYRSKGTERAIDLFFRNIFGASASVYFPERDIFKASSAKWIIPKYLEIEQIDGIERFVGVQIEGVDSGATAFVDSLVKNRINGSTKTNYVYYISNIVGSFKNGEKVRSSITGVIGPTILGSMNKISVLSGGNDFEIGDIVNLKSSVTGSDGVARVSNTSVVSGKVSFTLQNGGWGYDSNSQILISNSVFFLTNVQTTNAVSNGAFAQFETISQSSANIHYSSLTGGVAPGEYVYSINGNGVIQSTGVIISLEAVSNTEGYFNLSILDGDFNTATDVYRLSDTSNTASIIAEASVIGVTDTSATANVIKMSDTITIDIANSVTAFAVGDFIYQVNEFGQEVSNGVVSYVTYRGSDASLIINSIRGVFETNNFIVSRDTAANGVIKNISASIGVIDVDGSFIANTKNSIAANSSGVTAEITRISTGFGAAFKLSSTFLYEEANFFNTDLVSDYLSVQLDAPDYGLPAPGVQNVNSIITDSLIYEERVYGKIYDVILTNPGINYDAPPFVVVYEPETYSLDKRDYIVAVESASKMFTVGEVVTQNNVSIGIVKANSTIDTLYLERISLRNVAMAVPLIGLTSAATAVPIDIDVDIESPRIGINSAIYANTAVVNSSISELTVVDSGFSFSNGEIVDILGKTINGTGVVSLGGQGFSRGYYKNNNSVLSGNKYLRDGDYYQNFSYEIRSSITPDRYAEMLKDIIHIAGTKFFSKYVLDTTLETQQDITSEVSVKEWPKIELSLINY